MRRQRCTGRDRSGWAGGEKLSAPPVISASLFRTWFLLHSSSNAMPGNTSGLPTLTVPTLQMRRLSSRKGEPPCPGWQLARHSVRITPESCLRIVSKALSPHPWVQGPKQTASKKPALKLVKLVPNSASPHLSPSP